MDLNHQWVMCHGHDNLTYAYLNISKHMHICICKKEYGGWAYHPVVLGKDILYQCKIDTTPRNQDNW